MTVTGLPAGGIAIIPVLVPADIRHNTVPSSKPGNPPFDPSPTWSVTSKTVPVPHSPGVGVGVAVGTTVGVGVGITVGVGVC